MTYRHLGNTHQAAKGHFAAMVQQGLKYFYLTQPIPWL